MLLIFFSEKRTESACPSAKVCKILKFCSRGHVLYDFHQKKTALSFRKKRLDFVIQLKLCGKLQRIRTYV